MQAKIHIITKCDKFMVRKTETMNDGSRIVSYMDFDGLYTPHYENSAEFDLQVEAESHYNYHSEIVVSTLFDALI